MEFYTKLKKEGLSRRMSKERDASYLEYVRSHVNKEQRILDLACGYGRLTIPLAKEGYDIEGIDLTPDLIADAKRSAKVRFRVGDMLDLPYEDGSFDAIICMWSSFNHLLTLADQVTGLNEMHRVLKKGGLAIVDMPSVKVKEHVVTDDIDGHENTLFMHDEKSITEALEASQVSDFKVRVEEIGGRKRLIAFVRK